MPCAVQSVAIFRVVNKHLLVDTRPTGCLNGSETMTCRSRFRRCGIASGALRGRSHGLWLPPLHPAHPVRYDGTFSVAPGPSGPLPEHPFKETRYWSILIIPEQEYPYTPGWPYRSRLSTTTCSEVGEATVTV